jgi:hypothetical protein
MAEEQILTPMPARKGSIVPKAFAESNNPMGIKSIKAIAIAAPNLSTPHWPYSQKLCDPAQCTQRTARH